MTLANRIAKLEAMRPAANPLRVRRVIIEQDEPMPVEEPGELLIVRRIISDSRLASLQGASQEGQRGDGERVSPAFFAHDNTPTRA